MAALQSKRVATLPPASLARNWSKRQVIRSLIKASGDAVLLGTAYYLAFMLRFDGSLPPFFSDLFQSSVGFVVLGKLILLRTYQTYGYMWRKTSLHELVQAVKALSIASLLMLADYAIRPGELTFPRSIILFDWFLSVLFVSVYRTAPRLARDQSLAIGHSVRHLPWRGVSAPTKQHVLLYGAGDLGASLLSDIERKLAATKRVVGIIDDDPRLKGLLVRGVEVLGDRSAIPKLAARQRIDEIVVAISAISGRQLREIVEYCRQFVPNVQVAPGIDELFKGRVRVSDLREVQIEDLLGREAAKVDFDEEALHAFLEDRTILVTGAGGSIGGELCFQILKFRPRKIILFGRGENSIYATKHRLLPYAEGIEIEEVIGDIINYSKVDHVFSVRRPDLVFHAAADKHVPLMELNPDEAVLNNIIGTKNVLDAAAKHGAAKVVCISSDKAVNPSNIMGCCKRVSELVVRSRVGSPSISCAVRFGNVLGSRGSVIPLFKSQIADGGPITITHPDITRYFMTIPEAVLLVLQAGAFSKGGEIFLLEMGQPVRIADIARQMVRLSGLPEGSIDIRYVGLRPGEKLYEELAFPFETVCKTALLKLYRLEGPAVARGPLELQIARLKTMAIAMDFAAIRETLQEIVPEYEPGDHAAAYQPRSDVDRQTQLAASS